MGTWRFAAVGRDITSTFNAGNYNTEKLEAIFAITGNEIPKNSLEITLPKIILGAGKDLKLGEKFSFYPEINLDVTFDGMRKRIIKWGSH